MLLKVFILIQWAFSRQAVGWRSSALKFSCLYHCLSGFTVFRQICFVIENRTLICFGLLVEQIRHCKKKLLVTLYLISFNYFYVVYDSFILCSLLIMRKIGKLVDKIEVSLGLIEMLCLWFIRPEWHWCGRNISLTLLYSCRLTVDTCL